MILTCEKCATSFNFDESLIKPSGSKVRCSKCRHVFIVHPSAPALQADAGKQALSSGIAAAAGTAGLDDLDLAAIEKSLELDIDQEPEAGLKTAEDGVPEDEDLDFAAADFAAAADVGAITAGGDTGDLNFELDLDSLSDDDAAATGMPGGSTETMDFELDLDLGNSDTETAGAITNGPATDEIEFDLDFEGLTDASESSDAGRSAQGAAVTDAGTGDELDFELDMDLDDDAGVSETDGLGAGIDRGLAEKSVVSAAEGEFEQTQELDLSDVDSLIDLGHDKSDASATGDEAEDLDLELDVNDAAPTDQNTAAGAEATEELNLAELEEMLGKAEDTGPLQDSAEDGAEFDLALDLDPAFDAVAEKTQAAAPGDVEPTDDFDLTGLEDLLEEEAADSPTIAAAAVDEPIRAIEEAGVGALEDMLAPATEKPEAQDVSAESTEEFDLDFDADASDAAGLPDETPQAVPVDEKADVEFDSATLGEMLEMAPEPADNVPQADDDDFELQLDLEELPDADARIGAETAVDRPSGDLEFEVEKDAGLVPETAAADDTFEMGSLAENEKAHRAEEETYPEATETEQVLPPVTVQKRGGGLVRALFAAVLLVVVGAGALFAARFLGIDVPYLDRLKGVKIPYVSDLLGPKLEDAGNLKIAIDEKDVIGRFVTNGKLGTLYVVSGQVKNDYDDPRGSIRVTGKIYSKGRKLELEKTVLAGNVLSESELNEIDQTGIDQKLQNRSGEERKNLTVKKGETLPFMIVFSNLPNNPDEYTIEVAGSQKSK
ncbi:MAG: DUF3426 domain-containing protein [Deltaproteobacteria bacterium]|nr:DUF3426 domain-containing protein [Deltaproteobacteria bacterium]